MGENSPLHCGQPTPKDSSRFQLAHSTHLYQPPQLISSGHTYAQQLTNRTAAGPDGLPNEVLKYAPPRFFEELKQLSELCWGAAAYPPDWTASR